MDVDDGDGQQEPGERVGMIGTSVAKYIHTVSAPARGEAELS